MKKINIVELREMIKEVVEEEQGDDLEHLRATDNMMQRKYGDLTSKIYQARRSGNSAAVSQLDAERSALQDEWRPIRDELNRLMKERRPKSSPEEAEAARRQLWAVYGGDPEKNPGGLGT